MPNWCMNTVIAKHPDPAKMEALKEALKKDIFFEHILPLGEWEYEKACNTWSTKWEASNISWMHFTDDGRNNLNISFESAWCPPEEVYRKMIVDGWYMNAYFYEPGMGFVGKYGWIMNDDGSDGMYEESYEMDDAIPAELVEMFGIEDMYEDTEYELVYNDNDDTYIVKERIDEDAN
jgi:hypothetical protein